MTIQAVNQARAAAADAAPVIASTALSILEKTASMGAHLFEVGKESVLNHPWVALTTVAAIGIACTFCTYPKTISLPSTRKFVSNTEALLEKNKNKEAYSAISEFVLKVFNSTSFKQKIGPAGYNNQLATYFSNTVEHIMNGTACIESKIEVIDTILKTFPSLISTAQASTHTDMKAGRLEYLGINRDDKILEIHPLGDETHHEGKIPLKIIFESGKSIVYKPRSMLPEKLICDTHEGILAKEGFGTYRVVCQKDTLGNDYGYSDFIENIQGDNIVSTPMEVSQYISKLMLIEKVAQRIGLSDLHYKNIITDRLCPYIVDAEVFLNPPSINSGMFNEGNGALHAFDIMLGQDRNYVGKNKIWFDPTLIAGKQCDFRFGMSKTDLATIGVDLDTIWETTQLSPETQQRIEEVLPVLQNQQGRFVLKDTQHLSTMQYSLDQRNPKSIDIYIESVRDWVHAIAGFHFNEAAIDAIRAGVTKDILNHDVPVYYYDSQRALILYHDAVIGTR